MDRSPQKVPRRIVVALALLGAACPALAEEVESVADAVIEAEEGGVSQAEAKDTVDTLHAALLDVMKRATDLGFDGRRSALVGIVDDTLDLEYMALRTIGSRARKELGRRDRERWIASFSNFVLSNYARRFDGFSGQSFESLSEEPAPKKTVVVHTLLIRPNGKDVKLDYRLRSTPSGWRIIDIYLNGTASELALRHAKFSPLFKDVGLDQLIASVDEKAARR